MKYLFVVILICFTGCKNYSDFLSFQEVINVKVQVLKETYIGMPIEMTVHNNYIYINDFEGDSILWCFDKKNLNNSKRIIPKGEGPNEFLSPIQYFITDTSLVVHNRWHYSFQEFLYSDKDFSLSPIHDRIKISTDIDMLYPLPDHRYISSGRFDDSRFVIINNVGETILKCGNYPSYAQDEENYSNFSKFMFHQSMFGYNKTKDLLVSVTNHILEIWDCSIADSLLLKKRILLSPYEYKSQTGTGWASVFPEDWVEIGSRRICATDKNIYILYNPNTHEMKKAGKEVLNSEIYIFDWNGIPIKKLVTDKKLICFCIDEKENKAYCVLNAPEPSIGMFPI